MEAASREQMTSPKSRTSRPPSFSDSPKEDNENEKEKRDGFSKEDSGSESDTEDSSEESSEEVSEEEEPLKPAVNSVPPRARPTVNSLPSKPAVNSLKKPAEESDTEEETGSETEESSEEEEEEEPVKPGTRTSTTSSTTRTPPSRLQSAPVSAPRPGVGSTSKLLKSPFLDNNKKANAPSSPVSKTEPSRTSRFADKESTREDTKSRFGSYPTRTTADTTSNTSSTTTSTRSRISSTPSEDSQTKTRRVKRVTQRAATSYVGNGGKGDEEDEEENEEEDKKSNDISHRKVVEERKVTLDLFCIVRVGCGSCARQLKCALLLVGF